EKAVDRESAYEKLKSRAVEANASADRLAREASESVKDGMKGGAAGEAGGVLGGLGDVLFGSTGPRGGKREGVVDALAKS
ncbi:hypothetical protein CEJ58_20150, partial [Acinetobacter baumannii]|uniref:helicase HerA-like domain-containing protein n=2 Tax=Pseudomonadota TaxID=1224 RepID=UPI000BCD909B